MQLKKYGAHQIGLPHIKIFSFDSVGRSTIIAPKSAMLRKTTIYVNFCRSINLALLSRSILVAVYGHRTP